MADRAPRVRSAQRDARHLTRRPPPCGKATATHRPTRGITVPPTSRSRRTGAQQPTAMNRKKGKGGGSDFEQRRPKPRHCCIPSGQPGQPHASIPFAHNEQLKLENAAILASRKFAAYTVRRASESSANPLSLARRDVKPSKFMEKEG